MIRPILAINRNGPQDGDAEVDSAAEERVPNVHGEHDAFAEEDEHGEDGDSNVEGIESNLSHYQLPFSYIYAGKRKRNGYIRLTPNKRNRRDLHMIRIRIQNLRGT